MNELNFAALVSLEARVLDELPPRQAVPDEGLDESRNRGGAGIEDDVTLTLEVGRPEPESPEAVVKDQIKGVYHCVIAYRNPQI